MILLIETKLTTNCIRSASLRERDQPGEANNGGKADFIVQCESSDIALEHNLLIDDK
jgi:hypothetical protein